MRTRNFLNETEMPKSKVSADELQVIYCRYYFASKFVEGKQILEVGCGPGLGLGYLASKGATKIIGGDCTEASLRYAQQHNKRVELVRLDAHNLPFRDSCFDVIIAMAVTYCLRMDDFLDDCYRVLRTEGNLVFCIPNKSIPGFHPSPLSNKYYSVPELFALLGQHHFRAEIFGGFPISGRPTVLRFRTAFMWLIGKGLNLMPGGRKIKQLFSSLILGKTIVLEEDIDDGKVENIQPTPLAIDSPDSRHRMLYVYAIAQPGQL